MSDANPLTRRETETLNLLAEGLSNDEIALQLGISPNTVKVHVRNIFEKMGVQSRTEATMEAVRRGWIQVPGVDTSPDVIPETPSWPPLETSWRYWQLLVALVVLVMGAAVLFWPQRVPATAVTGVPSFTTDSGSVNGSVMPRQDVARWSQRAAMPTGRSRAAGSQIDGRLFVVGGETADGDTDVELVGVEAGVPQGSIVGPFDFDVCVDDLSSCVQYCFVAQLADDCQLCRGYSALAATVDVHWLAGFIGGAGAMESRVLV
jgi:DNA-binding CsgD family transcriptional regulator